MFKYCNLLRHHRKTGLHFFFFSKNDNALGKKNERLFTKAVLNSTILSNSFALYLQKPKQSRYYLVIIGNY